VVHLDTGHKFPEMIAFRRELGAEWDLDLVVVRNEAAHAAGVGPGVDALECCTALKTRALEQVVAERGFDALLLAIRRDEHAVRAKERTFSPRDALFRWAYADQPLEAWDQHLAPPPLEAESPRPRAQQPLPSAADEAGLRGVGHVRVHPLLDWRERDVWELCRRDGVPVHPLYFARAGRRYRSLGCMPCTQPVESSAATIAEIISELAQCQSAERAGRLQDKVMQKLRALGYM
jgi:sulfate adenylyltransferase subunit 2